MKRIRQILSRVMRWIDERYCSICGARFIRYPNGRWDCPNLKAEVQQEMRGLHRSTDENGAQ